MWSRWLFCYCVLNLSVICRLLWFSRSKSSFIHFCFTHRRMEVTVGQMKPILPPAPPVPPPHLPTQAVGPDGSARSRLRVKMTVWIQWQGGRTIRAANRFMKLPASFCWSLKIAAKCVTPPWKSLWDLDFFCVCVSTDKSQFFLFWVWIPLASLVMYLFLFLLDPKSEFYLHYKLYIFYFIGLSLILVSWSCDTVVCHLLKLGAVYFSWGGWSSFSLAVICTNSKLQ